MEHRQAIAEYAGKLRGMKFEPEEVVVVPGGKPIIFHSMLAIVNPGDEVIYPNPGFPIYESMIDYVGGKSVPYKLSYENEFRFDPDEIRRLVTKKTKMIVVNSPANPTGGVLEKSDLEAVASIAQERDLWVLSDEIYGQIMYEGRHYSIAALPGMKERTIILDGYSKTFAMTGWRAGYGVMNKTLVPHITRLNTNSISCTATFTQKACIEALRGTQEPVRKMVAEFKERRDFIVEGLNAIDGFECLKPKGAFYVFPRITKAAKGKTSQQVNDFLLNTAGVAALPGTSFGKYGEGYLRFSYATSISVIEEGLKRIKQNLKAL